MTNQPIKTLTILILCFFIAITSKAQKIKLKKGDGFTYLISSFNKLGPEDTNSIKSFNEGYYCDQYTFTVEDTLANGYQMKMKYDPVSQYSRNRGANDKQWETHTSFNRELVNSNTMYVKSPYLAEFNLSLNGEILGMKIVDKIIPNAMSNMPDSLTIRYEQNTINQFFNFNSEWKVPGKIVESHGTKFKVADITNNIATLTSLSDNNHKEVINRYNIETGLLEENRLYINNQNIENHYLIKQITNNNSPFSCRFTKNNYSVDTTFTQTNVIVRGKITNAAPNSNVSINWGESTPNSYLRCSIETQLKEDSTFELHLPLDKMQQVTFRCNEFSTFYLAPGDDVYLTVDMNAFDETIRASGKGSENINYCLQKFLFEEKERLSSGDIYQLYEQKCIELSPEELKNFFYDILEKRQAFLNMSGKNLSPEQYLAESWDIQTNIVSILKNYPRDQEYYRKQANKEPVHVNKSTFYDDDFYSLIHPDNDMMMFSPGYDHFIREYVFFFLDYKIRDITGKGNSITINNFFDQLYIGRYGFCNSAFNGVSQYSLKYSSVCDALDQAKWDVFVTLYHQFKEEYPNAYKTKLLDEAYEKAKTVAPGEPAFDFELSDFNGKKVRLSDFKGKVLYIDFWSTSCGPCVGSIKRHGKKLEELFKDTDIVLLYVALQNDVESARKFMEEQGINGVQLIAGGNEELLIRDKYYFDGIPHHYIIDREGNIVKRGAPEPYEIVPKPSILLDELKPKEESANSKTIYLLKIIVLSLGGILLLVVGILILNKRANKRKLNLSALNTKVRELELTAIRAQMNPHFMYNCLNSIQNLVQQNKSEEAYLYISKFAKLIRDVLKYSDKNEISLAEEIQMIENYVSLENLRFKINFNLSTEEKVDTYSIFIPPLLLQPIVENAILHGLSPKKGDKNLTLEIKSDSGYICIIIDDNGIGREAAQQNKSDNSGKGLSFCKERLELMKQKNQQDYRLSITDKKDNDGIALGTQLEICIAEE
nr:histidine kinase [uncultured Carboxylicivirga sp.]